MDAKVLQNCISAGESLQEKKEAVINTLKDSEQAEHDEEAKRQPLEPTQALKVFLDHISLASVPGIHNDKVVELKSSDTMGYAITFLYQQKVLGAPVLDDHMPEDSPLVDKYIGIVDFVAMILWALQEFENIEAQAEARGVAIADASLPPAENEEQQINGNENVLKGFFRLLQSIDSVKLAKDNRAIVVGQQVGTLAQFFRWGPFLPVHYEDSLLQIMLILSKHRLKAAPVVDSGDQTVKGFITQNVAVGLLLQCTGLEWFDLIADKKIGDFRFVRDQSALNIVSIFGDDVVSDAMRCLWKHRISAVPVIDRRTRRILGNVRNMDVHLLLDIPELFHQRSVLTVEDFMKADKNAGSTTGKSSWEDSFGAYVSAASLSVGNIALPKMSDPVTSSSEETLKCTMEKLLGARSDRSFVIDDKLTITGVVTLRDIINQFAPPLVEPPMPWSGFFDSALQSSQASND